jgi:sialidase-1
MPSPAQLALALAFALLAPPQGDAPAEAPARTATPVDVFVAGEGGHAIYRIPSILRLSDGALLAFAEGRDSKSDNGANDLVMRRSQDGGATWEPVRTVLDLAGRSLNNPCAVQVTRGAHEGRVLLMFQSYPTGCGEGCVKPGDDPATACLTLLVHSDDGGRTWSPPRDVTSSVRRGAPVTSVATGPGVGIQLVGGANAGRILMPFNQGPPNDWRVYAVHSDDGGDTWSMGDVAPEDGSGHANEVQFAERADGTVVLVARQFGGGSRRKVAASTDGGERWSTLQRALDLVDPSCMGGLITLRGGAGDRMVCTGPSSRTARLAGRAWFSDDGGRSWPRVVPIADGFFAYSVPVQLGPDRLGVLFERDDYARISFVTLPLPW